MGLKIKFISPINTAPTPMLFDTFIEPFTEQGHQIVERVEDADIVFHDLYSNLGVYNTYETGYVYRNKLPIVVFDATDFGAMSKEVWDKKAWEDLAANQPLIYFMRKMDKTIDYPSFVHPYELTLYEDCVFTPVGVDALSQRPYDICWIGNMSPTRVHAMNGLIAFGKFKIDFHWTRDGKLPHGEWLNRHRNAKLFLTACGGGFGDERPHQLIYTAPMLRVSNNQLIVHNFRHGIDCIEISEHPTEEELNYLHQVLNDKFLLYDIYQSGMKRLRKYFNKNYRAKYILDIINKELVC